MNVERMLGSLLKQGLKSGKRNRRRRRNRGSGLGRLAGGAVGMGVVGIAIAAFEHFTSKKNAASAGGSPEPLMSPPSSSPGQTGSAPPPPPPGPAPSMAPPPPPTVELKTSEAELLIQAMVAAANADGKIDSEELRAVRRRMTEAGLSEEERDEVEKRLQDPPSLDDIVAAIDNPRLGAQVYAVTLAAIEVDTPGEREYLQKLRDALELPQEVVARLHEEFDFEDQ